MRFGLSQASQNHGLDPTHVDQVEGESTTARLLQPMAPVLLGQAQELLRLTELGPGKVAGEQGLGEAADTGAEFLGLADHVIGVPTRIGGEVFRIVLIIGRPSSGLLDGVRLDQLALEIDPHEGTISSDGDPFAEILGRYRIESLAELDVVVRMHCAVGPARGIEAIPGDRQERGPLFLLENGERTAPRGAVDAGARDLEAPADRLTLDVFLIEPALSTEEVLSHVWDLPFDVGLALGVVGGGRIDDESSVGGILRKGPLEDGLVALGPDDGGSQVVEDDPRREAPEELPGRFQAIDHVLQLLGGGHMDVDVAAMDQGDHESPEHPPELGVRIDDVAEAAEVDLADFPRTSRSAEDRDSPPAELAVLDGESVEGAVGNLDPLAFEEPTDFGQRQTALVIDTREPLLDLIPPGKQQLLRLPEIRLLGARSQSLEHPNGERLVGLCNSGLPADLPSQPEVGTDRLAVPTRRGLDDHLAFAPMESAKNL